MEYQMKTIDIKGKPYIQVVERIKYAHSVLSNRGLSITTEIVSNDDTQVTFKAIVTYEDQTYTGHSSASKINGMMKDVAVEVAETSAVGRALGMAGIGIETGIASVEEIRKRVKSATNEDDLLF